jgi:hypothetical protein
MQQAMAPAREPGITPVADAAEVRLALPVAAGRAG